MLAAVEEEEEEAAVDEEGRPPELEEEEAVPPGVEDGNPPDVLNDVENPPVDDDADAVAPSDDAGGEGAVPPSAALSAPASDVVEALPVPAVCASVAEPSALQAPAISQPITTQPAETLNVCMALPVGRGETPWPNEVGALQRMPCSNGWP